MAAGEEKCGGVEGGGDLYAVLGLKKECTDSELRVAYKKLAMRWHPDRCTASGNSKRVEEAKEKFQEIQGAYSVLSDSNKRFLYDVGVYDSDDNDDNLQGMDDFLGEMAQMMSQAQPMGNGQESFEELQRLFMDMFQADLDAGFCAGPTMVRGDLSGSSPSPSPPAGLAAEATECNGGGNGVHKRNSSAMEPGKTSRMDGFGSGLGQAGFCFGQQDSGMPRKLRGGGNSKRRNGRKQKTSAEHDVSSADAGVSPSHFAGTRDSDRVQCQTCRPKASLQGEWIES